TGGEERPRVGPRRPSRPAGRAGRDRRLGCQPRRGLSSPRLRSGRGRGRGAGSCMIRVLIAEDQAMFPTAIRRLPALESPLQVVAEVSRGDEVLEAARRSEAGGAPGGTGGARQGGA